jgi:hypothetical protein
MQENWSYIIFCLFPGSLTDKLDLNAGDDAVDVKWTPIEKNSTLDTSHNDLIHKVAQYMNAHWSSDPR